MSAPYNANPYCSTQTNTQLVGPAGQGVFTYTTADFVVPALNGGVFVNLVSSDQLVVGSYVTVNTIGGTSIIGDFLVSQIGLNGQVGLTYVDGDNSGDTIPSGSKVTISGTAGRNAYTICNSSFTIGAVGVSTAPLAFDSTGWMALGQAVILTDNTDFATFEVASIIDDTTATLKWLGYASDSWNSGDTIIAPTKVVVSGRTNTVGTLPTPLANNSLGNPSAVNLPTGVAYGTLTLPLSSLATGLSTSAVTILNAYTPGYRFYIASWQWVSTIVGAGAGASQTFTLSITGAPVTGGSLNVTLASTNAIGSRTAATAITALNTGGPTDTISVNMASGGTVFTSGSGYFLINIVNLDTANAMAAMNASITALINAL